MTQEIEEGLEEKDTIQPMDDKPGTPKEPPLTSGHVPFGEIGITPPPAYGVMNVCNVLFDHLKKRMVQQREKTSQMILRIQSQYLQRI